MIKAESVFEAALQGEDYLQAWQAGYDAGVTGGWQPIETAPKDGTPLDLWDPSRGGRVCDAKWDHHYFRNGEPYGEKSWGLGDLDGPPPQPSHWRPRPNPPSGRDK